MRIPAAYFDGCTSHRYTVEIMHSGGMLLIDGDIHRTALFRDVEVLERAGKVTRKIAFPDGAYLEVGDVQAFDALMREAGYRDPIAIRMHHSWRWVLMALAALIVIVVPGYLYGLPAAAKIIAKRLPESVQQSIGHEALSFLDKRMFDPSELPIERQQAIVQRFRHLKPPKAGVPTYEIVFRKSRIGPNAFALPSGKIVMTDELVKLLNDDDAIMGVLAHEMGHLHERHMLRRMIQASAVGLFSLALMGDVSSVVTAIPTAMLDMKYSRDAEREADDYAIAMMQTNDIDLQGLVLTFEKLGKQAPQLNAYLSSHPAAKERIARVQKAARDGEKLGTSAGASPASAQTSSALTAAADGKVAVLQGEWHADVEEWVKKAKKKGLSAKQEAELRKSLTKARMVFDDESHIDFHLPGTLQGRFAYNAKPVTQDCYTLEIAELGHRLVCVSGQVMLMDDPSGGGMAPFVRQ